MTPCPGQGEPSPGTVNQTAGKGKPFSTGNIKLISITTWGKLLKNGAKKQEGRDGSFFLSFDHLDPAVTKARPLKLFRYTCQ